MKFWEKILTTTLSFISFKWIFYSTGLAIVVLLGNMKTWEIAKKYFFATYSVDFLTFKKKWDGHIVALDFF